MSLTGKAYRRLDYDDPRLCQSNSGKSGKLSSAMEFMHKIMSHHKHDKNGSDSAKSSPQVFRKVKANTVGRTEGRSMAAAQKEGLRWVGIYLLFYKVNIPLFNCCL